MARMIDCVVLKHEAEGLERVPFPGELGERIFASVSKEGWRDWLARLQMVINENQLNTADVRSLEIIETHMKSFLFDEGDVDSLPPGFRAGGAAKK